MTGERMSEDEAQSTSVSPLNIATGKGDEKLQPKLVAFLQLLLLFPFLPGTRPTFQEIRRRSYGVDTSGPAATSFLASRAPETVLELSKELFEAEESRLNVIQDKTRSLLAVCALLGPFITLLLPRVQSPALLILPLAFVIVTVFILLISTGIGTRRYPGLGEELLSQADEASAQRQVAQSYVLAISGNVGATNFLADVYRAGVRSLTRALVCVFGVFCISPWFERSAAPAVQVLPAPISQVSVWPSTQPTPYVNVTVAPATQPAPKVYIRMPATEQKGGRPPATRPLRSRK